MTNVQELLDKEASLSNRRYHILQQIKAMRGTEPPVCWGMDDCSAQILSTCPWRIDCSSFAAACWQESQLQNPAALADVVIATD